MSFRSCKVAVIGAGMSGLITARSLLRESHSVVLFEKSNRIGGTWVYTPESDSDPLSLNPTRKIVHGSLYKSLRTNLPRHIMSFSDYAFNDKCFGDDRLFPGHEEVLKFLEGFAENSEEGILGNVRFGVEVVRVRMGNVKDEWIVEFRTDGEEEVRFEVFEAVVVCNGHHTVPRVAEIQGIDKWPGKQLHSHNYRIPEPFEDKIVVIIGRGPSAYDIARDIAQVAKEVHMASRSPDIVVEKLNYCSKNIWQHSMIKQVKEDGSVVFNDGSSLYVDIILHCTGYKYDFPFLDTEETVSIDDNRVGPLYKHIFPPHLAPWLSFVGLLNKTILFWCAELQATWVARALSGKITLPSEMGMTASVDEYYLQLEKIGKPKHHTHFLYPKYVEYLNWLGCELGLPPLEEWRIQFYREAIESVSSLDGRYRDTFDADYWMKQSQH